MKKPKRRYGIDQITMLSLTAGDIVTVQGSRPLEVVLATTEHVLVASPVGTFPGVSAVRWEDIDEPSLD